jgi:hypothetical protein
VEIIRPSEHQLIFKTYGNMRKVIREFVAIAPFWMVTLFVFGLISHIVLPVNSLTTTILVGLFPYVGIGCIAIATTRDITVIFDLDLQAVRVECYWILFKKRQCQNYDLTNIKNIVVEEDNEVDWFYIKLRQYNGEDIYVSYSEDRSITDMKAQEIRDFLGLSIKSIK